MIKRTHYIRQLTKATRRSPVTALLRSYLDILTGTFMVRQLQPWHININKRQVKSPKIYLRDPGQHTYPMDDRISAYPIEAVPELVDQLR